MEAIQKDTEGDENAHQVLEQLGQQIITDSAIIVPADYVKQLYVSLTENHRAIETRLSDANEHQRLLNVLANIQVKFEGQAEIVRGALEEVKEGVDGQQPAWAEIIARVQVN